MKNVTIYAKPDYKAHTRIWRTVSLIHSLIHSAKTESNYSQSNRYIQPSPSLQWINTNPPNVNRIGVKHIKLGYSADRSKKEALYPCFIIMTKLRSKAPRICNNSKWYIKRLLIHNCISQLSQFHNWKNVVGIGQGSNRGI